MNYKELARKFINSNISENAFIFHDYSDLNPVNLAYALKDICNEVWHNNPVHTKRAFGLLEELKLKTNNTEISALTVLCQGLVSLGENQLETAIEEFDQAQSAFLSINDELHAAESQARKVIALAILGRYEEAIECGLKARHVFEKTNQTETLELLELNLGNLYLRRNYFQEAENFLLSARNRAIEINQNIHRAVICNSLALVYSSQNRFRESELLYKEALSFAIETEQSILEADIEANLGELALFQGKFNYALDHLERARRKFIQLSIEQRSTQVELEIADAYLELNLNPEARTLYEKLIEDFNNLGLRAEQARATAQYGRSLMSSSEFDKAESYLSKAQKLYDDEGNPVGSALVKLLLAQLFFEKGQFERIKDVIHGVEKVFEQSQARRHLLITRWLMAEVLRREKNYTESESLLTSILTDSLNQTQPQISRQCLTSLGLLKSDTGDLVKAEKFFLQAIDLIENMRSPLPGEEFRTAFFADKLVPYNEMLRICLNDNSGNRTHEAFGFVERARSRALADKIGSEFQIQPKDPFEAELLEQQKKLREELNWYYSQLSRIQQNFSTENLKELDEIQSAINNREKLTLDLLRQLQQSNTKVQVKSSAANISILQKHLSDKTALIEYASIDGEWLAFVLTDEGIKAVRFLGSEDETLSLIEQFYFQIGSLRQGASGVRNHLELLTKRAQHYLHELYQILLQPLEEIIGNRRLAIVPHKALHYVPFQALFDGEKYVNERREVCYAPSALIFEHSLSLPRHKFQKALLMGVADEYAPNVKDEIEALTSLFPESFSFLNEEAKVETLIQHAQKADVIHLACHGQFRQDNPTFSTLHLGDGWLTVHDAANLKLLCELVTLSACETGINLVAPGDELIGLSRGFFAAGTPALLLSLWSVDDESTKSFMLSFYKSIQNGSKPVEALRESQLTLMKNSPHPFFWSPFVLIGRWE